MRSNPDCEVQRLLAEADAAAYLGLARKTLEKWRNTGVGPCFIRIGTRGVRYARDDLDEWIARNRRLSTSDPGPEARASA